MTETQAQLNSKLICETYQIKCSILYLQLELKHFCQLCTILYGKYGSLFSGLFPRILWVKVMTLVTFTK